MRKNRELMDEGALANVEHNDASGAKKVVVVEPVVKSAVIATDTYPFGSLVKVTGTTYTLDLLNKAYSSSISYVKGELVTQGGFVYLCTNNTTGTFDAQSWSQKSAKSIGPVTITAGAVVCCGEWHNTVSAIGFLCEDASLFR